MAVDDTGQNSTQEIELKGIRRRLNQWLFEIYSGTGRVVNLTMLGLIMLAVLVSMLDTVDDFHQNYGDWVERWEYGLLVVFGVEYLLRIYAARNRWHYMRSFNGLVDLMTVLPLLIFGDAYVLVRLLRLVRVIRVAISFPIVRSLFSSIRGSFSLLLCVLGTIALVSVLVGNLMHVLEPAMFANAFEGAWWSLVTMSTVGYGDFVPLTAMGRTVAAGLIMFGICMFAMITAVISVRVGRMVNCAAKCKCCGDAIPQDYLHCHHCGAKQQGVATEKPEPELAIFHVEADDV